MALNLKLIWWSDNNIVFLTNLKYWPAKNSENGFLYKYTFYLTISNTTNMQLQNFKIEKFE